MEKKLIDKQLTVVRDEETNLIKIIRINPANKELEIQKIYGWSEEQKPYFFSAYYAAADYLRHRRYDHPLTQEGLHFRRDRGISASDSILQFGIASVCVDFENANGLLPTLPSVDDHPYGWARVNKEGRFYSFASFKDPLFGARKHRVVDWLIQGYGFELYVPTYLAVPKNNGVNGEVAWAEAMVAIWQNTNDAEALAERNQRINSSIDSQSLYEGAQVTKKAFGSGAQDMNSLVETSVVRMFDNTELELNKLPQRRYRVYNGSSPIRTLLWNPGNDDSVAYMAQVVRRKWTLREI
jgi:hypothetical protein